MCIGIYIYIYIYIYSYIYIYIYPRSPQKRLRKQEDAPRKQGDTMCVAVFDAHHRTVFSESLLGKT